MGTTTANQFAQLARLAREHVNVRRTDVAQAWREREKLIGQIEAKAEAGGRITNAERARLLSPTAGL